jgi:hypothetical protein
MLKNGVPFAMLFSCDELLPHEFMAMSITFSEFEGGEFDWANMCFKERDK